MPKLRLLSLYQQSLEIKEDEDYISPNICEIELIISNNETEIRVWSDIGKA